MKLTLVVSPEGAGIVDVGPMMVSFTRFTLFGGIEQVSRTHQSRRGTTHCRPKDPLK
jgi:hypothetical protein